MQKIIDVHTHIFNEASYKSYFAKAGEKVQKCLVLHWCLKDIEETLKFVETKKNLFLVAGINMDKPLAKQLKTIERLFKEKRAVGAKLYPGYQHFYPSDKIVYPVARLCEKYGRPLIIHSGDVYDLRGPSGGALLKYTHPIHVDDLAKAFPKLNIVIAHFGFPNFMEAANVVSKNANVYTEISGTINDEGNVAELAKEYVLDLKKVFTYFKSVKAKTMFGTDYVGEDAPLNQVDPYVDLVRKTFNKREAENAYYKLAERLFF